VLHYNDTCAGATAQMKEMIAQHARVLEAAYFINLISSVHFYES
jgi:hypothetical protein